MATCPTSGNLWIFYIYPPFFQYSNICPSKPHRSRGLLCKKTAWKDDIRTRTGLVWFGCLPCPGWERCPVWRGAQWRTRGTSSACLSAPAHAHQKIWNIKRTVWRDPYLSFKHILIYKKRWKTKLIWCSFYESILSRMTNKDFQIYLSFENKRIRRVR